MDIEHRVIFGDTDQMGVVYYANYFRYFEAARAEYIRRKGKSYKDMQRLGVGFPVIRAHCDYKRPALYEDLLTITTLLTSMGGASLRFDYRIMRETELLASGYTEHCAINARGRPCAIPDEFRDALPLDT